MDEQTVTYRTREELAEELRRLRIQRRWTRTHVGSLIMLTAEGVRKIETGERGLSTSELVALAEAYEVTLDVLVRSDPMAVEEMETDRHYRNHPDPAVRAGWSAIRGLIQDYFGLRALVPYLD